MPITHVTDAMLQAIKEIDLLKAQLATAKAQTARLLYTAESYLVEIERLRKENNEMRVALSTIKSLDKKGNVSAVASYTAHLALKKTA